MIDKIIISLIFAASKDLQNKIHTTLAATPTERWRAFLAHKDGYCPGIYANPKFFCLSENVANQLGENVFSQDISKLK